MGQKEKRTKGTAKYEERLLHRDAAVPSLMARAKRPEVLPKRQMVSRVVA